MRYKNGADGCMVECPVLAARTGGLRSCLCSVECNCAVGGTSASTRKKDTTEAAHDLYSGYARHHAGARHTPAHRPFLAFWRDNRSSSQPLPYAARAWRPRQLVPRQQVGTSTPRIAAGIRWWRLGRSSFGGRVRRGCRLKGKVRHMKGGKGRENKLFRDLTSNRAATFLVMEMSASSPAGRSTLS